MRAPEHAARRRKQLAAWQDVVPDMFPLMRVQCCACAVCKKWPAHLAQLQQFGAWQLDADWHCMLGEHSVHDSPGAAAVALHAYTAAVKE